MKASEIEKYISEQAKLIESTSCTQGEKYVKTVRGYYYICNTCGFKQFRVAPSISRSLEKGLTVCKRCNTVVKFNKVLNRFINSYGYKNLFLDKTPKVVLE